LAGDRSLLGRAQVIDLSGFDLHLDKLAKRLSEAEQIPAAPERNVAIQALEREIRDVHRKISKLKDAAMQEMAMTKILMHSPRVSGDDRAIH
jgi:hypothetical protein